jgi:hypothetical protein
VLRENEDYSKIISAAQRCYTKEFYLPVTKDPILIEGTVSKADVCNVEIHYDNKILKKYIQVLSMLDWNAYLEDRIKGFSFTFNKVKFDKEQLTYLIEKNIVDESFKKVMEQTAHLVSPIFSQIIHYIHLFVPLSNAGR